MASSITDKFEWYGESKNLEYQNLPEGLLKQIFQDKVLDQYDLFDCSKVNRTFKKVATRVLTDKFNVQLSPTFTHHSTDVLQAFQRSLGNCPISILYVDRK